MWTWIYLFPSVGLIHRTTRKDWGMSKTYQSLLRGFMAPILVCPSLESLHPLGFPSPVGAALARPPTKELHTLHSTHSLLEEIDTGDPAPPQGHMHVCGRRQEDIGSDVRRHTHTLGPISYNISSLGTVYCHGQHVSKDKGFSFLDYVLQCITV